MVNFYQCRKCRNSPCMANTSPIPMAQSLALAKPVTGILSAMPQLSAKLLHSSSPSLSMPRQRTSPFSVADSLNAVLPPNRTEPNHVLDSIRFGYSQSLIQFDSIRRRQLTDTIQFGSIRCLRIESNLLFGSVRWIWCSSRKLSACASVDTM
jgi:hypothetical protein